MLFNSNAPCELSGMVFVNLLTGTPVQILLALIKGGFKIMCEKFRNPLDRGQKPRVNNKTRDEAKVGIAWVS